MTEITMPSLSDSMQEGTILSWLKADGEPVDAGEELLEIETDKATMTYESPSAGVLSILAAVGETHPVGAVIARLAPGAEVASDDDVAPEADVSSDGEVPLETDMAPAAGHGAASDEPVGATSAAQPVGGHGGAQPADGNGTGPAVKATPLARRLAQAHGVDLGALEGSGPRGRITRSDVAASAGLKRDPRPRAEPRAVPGGSASLGADARPAATAAPGSDDQQRTSTEDLTRMQQVIARRMAEAKATIPEFQVQTEARIDGLIALREELKALAEEPVPSLNDFIVKACAIALRRHPRVNGSYRDGRFELHERIHIGIAVAATDALVVATITDADERSVRSIASESRRLAARVRDASVTPPELSGATFTVSNLGMYGMTAITPVINPPQAAILGVGAARALPELLDGRLQERHLLTLTLSCDHRILYGADAALFLSDIRAGLETPLRLLL